MAWWVVGAALFRSVLLAVLPRVVHGDEAAYLLIGRSIWQGLGTPHTHPPLFPLLAGAVWRVTGNPELGSGVWFVVFGALTVVPVYLLAEALGGKRVALLATGLTCFYPALTTAIPFWSSMTEPLFIFLIYSGLACAFFAERDRRPNLFWLSGALLSCAYLTRPEGGLWLATTVLAVIASRRLRGLPMGGEVWKGLARLVAGFLLTALPYLLVIHHDTGRWLASGKVAIAYEVGEAVLRDDPQLFDQVTNSLDQGGGTTQWLSERRFERGMLQRILHQPREVAGRVARNLVRLARRFAGQTVFPFYLAMFAALAWVLRPRTRERFAGDLWLLAAALPVAAFLFFHIEQRYLCPAFPALLIWVAAGLDETLRRLERWPRRRARAAARTALGVLVLAGLAAGHWSVYAEKSPAVWPSRREAGWWIRDHTPAQARVLAFDDGFCVYGDRPCVPSPRAPYPEWIAYARERNVQFLVVEEDEVTNFRPFLAFLLAEQPPPPDLERVFRTVAPVNPVVVFRLLPASS